MPYGNYSIPPPVDVTLNAPAEPDQLNLVRDNELIGSKVNFKAVESVDATGSDMPGDIATTQFFFNLGIRYFMASGVQRKLEGIVQQMESLELEGSDKNKRLMVDGSPTAPANTPVSAKPASGGAYGSGGYRTYDSFRGKGRGGHGAGYRPPWNNNNTGGFMTNAKKDIKFNSNVKNVHKNDAKATYVHSQPSTGDKQSPQGPHCSPLSPIPHEAPSSNPAQANQMPEYPVALPQSNYIQQYPYIPQQQIVYQTYNDENGYAYQIAQPQYREFLSSCDKKFEN